MKRCFVCKHDGIKHGTSSRMFELDDGIVIIKNVPCLVCQNCGETYLETKTVIEMERIINARHGELELLDYSRLVA